MAVRVSVNLVPRVFVPLDQRSENASSGSNHACAIDADCAVKPDGQNLVISSGNFVISKSLLSESLVFRPLVKGNEDSGNEIGCLC